MNPVPTDCRTFRRSPLGFDSGRFESGSSSYRVAHACPIFLSHACATRPPSTLRPLCLMFLSAEQGGGRNHANCKPWRWTSGCPRRTADDNVERRAALDGHRSSFAGVQAVIVSTIPGCCKLGSSAVCHWRYPIMGTMVRTGMSRTSCCRRK